MTQLDMTFAENQDWQKRLLGWFEKYIKILFNMNEYRKCL